MLSSNPLFETIVSKTIFLVYSVDDLLYFQFSFAQQHVEYFLGMSTKSLFVRGIDISYLVRNSGDTLAHHFLRIVLLHCMEQV